MVNFEYLNDLMEIIRSLDKLWTLVRQIREFENLHKDMLFTEVDCDTTLQVVEKIELELQYKVTRENPKVCAFVRDRCMELNRLIPLVYKLQNKKDEITDRMSTLIVEELGFDIWPKDRGAVTLKFLIDHDILAHERELNLLHQQAVKEHNIHKKIWTLKYQLEDLSLHVEAYGESILSMKIPTFSVFLCFIMSTRIDNLKYFAYSSKQPAIERIHTFSFAGTRKGAA